MHCQGNSWCVSGVNDVHKEMGCRKLVRQSRSSMVLKEVSATSHFNISWSFNFSGIEIPTPLLSCWIILDGSNHLIVPQCHLSSFCHLNDLTTYNETRLGGHTEGMETTLGVAGWWWEVDPSQGNWYLRWDLEQWREQIVFLGRAGSKFTTIQESMMI